MNTGETNGPIREQVMVPLPEGPEWDEAFLRVESYLRAHQIESRLVLNRLALEIIQEAAKISRTFEEGGGGDPVLLAMREAERRMTQWFTQVLGDAVDPDDERVGTRGRIALVMADVPGRWPQHFLAATPPPRELVAVRESPSPTTAR